MRHPVRLHITLLVVCALQCVHAGYKDRSIGSASLVDFDKTNEPIPDGRRNPQDRIDVRCEACKSVLVFIMSRFAKVTKANRYTDLPVKKYVVVAALDSLCHQERLNAGLARREPPASGFRFITLEKAEPDEISLYKGGWISDFWMEECDSIMGRIEDDDGEFALYRNYADAAGKPTMAAGSPALPDLDWESKWCPVCEKTTQNLAIDPTDDFDF